MKKAMSYPTSLRFTLEGRRLLEELATKMGISMAAVIEIALRLLAERELPPVPPIELPEGWQDRMMAAALQLAAKEYKAAHPEEVIA